MNTTLERSLANAEIMLKGRLFNWRPRAARRDLRTGVITRVYTRYLERYLPATEGVPEQPVVEDDAGENVFSMWLQGEDNAPPLVQACLRSMRANCRQPLVMLDERSVFDWVDLPGFIMDKRRRGKIGHAHFADIVRVELLHNHGGFWFDATCFLTDAVPQTIVDQDFFVCLTGRVNSYGFMQNGFIRSRKGAYLLEAWRAMIHEYWRHEPRILYYYVHQLLFKVLVQSDPRAAAHFAHMPHLDHDAAHELWWGYGARPFDSELWERFAADSFFQKTTYGSPWVKNPPPGSFADEMINRLYR